MRVTNGTFFPRLISSVTAPAGSPAEFAFQPRRPVSRADQLAHLPQSPADFDGVLSGTSQQHANGVSMLADRLGGLSFKTAIGC
jgi:hypothetical protein